MRVGASSRGAGAERDNPHMPQIDLAFDECDCAVSVTGILVLLVDSEPIGEWAQLLGYSLTPPVFPQLN